MKPNYPSADSRSQTSKDIERIPVELLDTKSRAIIDLILSDKGGRMTVDQIANLFSVDRSLIWNTIRSHAITPVPLGQHSMRSTISMEAT